MPEIRIIPKIKPNVVFFILAQFRGEIKIDEVLIFNEHYLESHMDDNEKIHAHVVSVWRESKSFFSVGGKEGMLFLTDNHLLFVRRTERMKKWWKAAVTRQVVTLHQNDNVMIRHDGYDEEDLKIDLEEKSKYVDQVTFNNILEIGVEEKQWGTLLKTKVIDGEKNKEYQYSIVRDWVQYPLKDPTSFLKVNWNPIVEFVKSRQIIKE